MPIDLKKNIMFKFFNDISANSDVFERIDIGSEINITDHASEITGLVYDYTWHPDNGGQLIIKGQNNDPDSLMRGIYKLRRGRQSAKIESIRDVIGSQTGCQVKISRDLDSIEISDMLPRDTFRCHPRFACEPWPDKKKLKEKRKRCNNGANRVQKKKKRNTLAFNPSAPNRSTIGPSDYANSSPIYDPSIPSTCPMGAFAKPHGSVINYPRACNRSPMEPSADTNSSAIYNPFHLNIWPMGVTDNADTGDRASVASGAVADNRINPVPPPAGLGQPHTADLEHSPSSSSGWGVGDSCEPLIPSIDPWQLGSSTGSPSGNNSVSSSVFAVPHLSDSNLKSGDIQETSDESGEDQSLIDFLSTLTDQ